MTTLKTLKRNWEGFARTDPFWAICTDPTRQAGRWEPEEFFATGEAEIHTVLSHLLGLGQTINVAGRALDFGCGAGRLTQALARRFAEAYGVDISPTMIETAERFNRHGDRCTYRVNDTVTLSFFPDSHFSFVYTSIVLQHIDPRYTKEYLREFLRVLNANGVLVFQIPDRYRPEPNALQRQQSRSTQWLKSMRHGLRVRSRLRSLTRAVLPAAAPETSGEYRMEMHCTSEADVRSLMEQHGARVIDVQLTNSTELDFNGELKYLKDEPEYGYVSKQYCVVKKSCQPSAISRQPNKEVSG